MKVQVKQFNTHQTAKVFAILMAVASLLFMIPFALMFSLLPTPTAPDGSSVSFAPFSIMIFVMPIFQAIFGYIFVRIGAWVYNKISPRIGGFEFVLEETNS